MLMNLHQRQLTNKQQQNDQLTKVKNHHEKSGIQQ